MTDGALPTGDLGQRIGALSPEKRALLERWMNRAAAPAPQPGRIPPRGDHAGPLPLSFAQERLWFLDRFDPGTPVYNVYTRVTFAGAFDADAMQRAVDEVVRRHEALRTTFPAGPDGRPVQVVHPPRPLPLRLVDLRHVPADVRAEAARQAGEDEARAPFDLVAGPLLRATVLRTGDEEHALLLTLHHIVADGWSMRLLFRELATLYEAFGADRDAGLPPLPVQYADFALWQRERLAGPGLERELAFWREALAGAPPVLPLPADRPRPPMQSFRGALHSFRLSPELAEGVRALCQRTGATLFMALLAGFQALLHRHGAGDDLVVGTPIANRTRAELEGTIGFFANTLVLRTDASGDPTFLDFVERVRQTTLAAYAHQDLPFEKLVEELQPERNLAHNPLFQVMFLMQAGDGSARLTGSEGPAADAPIGPEVDTGTSKFDINLGFSEVGAGLLGTFEYAVDLFDPPTIARMADHLPRLLAAAVARPETRLSALPLLADDERRMLVDGWNATSVAVDAEGGAPALFDEAAARWPDAIAVECGGERMTYADLRRRADALARHLRALGAGPETVVGLCAERSAELAVGVLGVLKSGAAYLPLDPAYPRERLAFMLRDSGARLVLASSTLADAIPADESIRIVLLAPEPMHSPVTEASAQADIVSSSRRIHSLGSASADVQDADPAASADPDRASTDPADPRPVRIHPDNVAYVIYTSGSTGTPKGVTMPHGPLCSLVRWQTGASTPGARRTLQLSSPSFDVSFQEIFATWHAGGTLVMAPHADRADVAELATRLSAERIERIFLPFVALQALADEAAARPALPLHLREVVTAGEALRVTPQLAALMARLDGAALHNQYGPSETHVVTEYVLRGDAADWPALPPIGRPVANARAYVLDARHGIVPVNVPGELYLGGGMIARGYRGRPGMTAERFVPDPFSPVPGGRMYRTGDRVRWRADGTLEFLGRADHQVKIRGFRVEPGEVEAVLDSHPLLAGCAVAAREGAGGLRLVAWTLARPGAEAPAAGELRAWLRERLPEHMVPSAFVAVDELPRTPSGKVDRRRLAAPDAARGDERAYVAPRTALEEVMAGTWAEVLGAERVGVHDDFFDLGGHSLLVTQVVSRVRDTLGHALTVRAVFETPTVATLCAAMGRDEAAAERLETAARVVLEVARLTDDEVDAAGADLALTEGAAR